MNQKNIHLQRLKEKYLEKVADLQSVKEAMLLDECDLLRALIEEVCELHELEPVEQSLFRGPAYGIRYKLKDPFLFEDEEL